MLVGGGGWKLVCLTTAGWLVCRSLSRSLSRPVSQSVGHPGILSVSRLVGVSVGRVVGHFVGHSVSRSIGELVSRVVGHSVGPVDLYPLVSGWWVSWSIVYIVGDSVNSLNSRIVTNCLSEQRATYRRWRNHNKSKFSGTISSQLFLHLVYNAPRKSECFFTVFIV